VETEDGKKIQREKCHRFFVGRMESKCEEEWKWHENEARIFKKIENILTTEFFKIL
jgi:hypothetical protein